MKIILQDNTEIQLAQATYDNHYIVNCPNVVAYQTIWNYFTSENLSDFKLVDDNGNIVKHTLYIRLLSTQAIINPDNTITGHFYFGNGTTISNEYEQAGKILLGEEE